MLLRTIAVWIFSWTLLWSQPSLEEESWFYQILTRLKSKDPQIVRSAQEALIAHGAVFQEKLLPFKKDPLLGPPLQKVFECFQSPGDYYLQQAILFSEGSQKELLQTLTAPLTLKFTYESMYFSERTVEVCSLQGSTPRLSKLVQQVWIHHLDQSGHFQVIEPKISKASIPPAIQIGGEVQWLFLQGNARLQLDLWMKEKEHRILAWKTVLAGSGEEEWSTALKLIEPQIQQWLEESLPKKQDVVYPFFPPKTQLEWIGLFLAQEGHFTEALSLLSSPQTEEQRFNLAMIQEASGHLSEAIAQIQALQIRSSEQQNALQRLKIRTHSD
ncbi:MAG: hypothetical protein AABZ60_18415 [Planctomycetota bacterium]